VPPLYFFRFLCGPCCIKGKYAINSSQNFLFLLLPLPLIIIFLLILASVLLFLYFLSLFSFLFFFFFFFFFNCSILLFYSFSSSILVSSPLQLSSFSPAAGRAFEWQNSALRIMMRRRVCCRPTGRESRCCNHSTSHI
jgi:hypothetical protein